MDFMGTDGSKPVAREARRVPLQREVILKFQNFAGFVTEYSANLSMGGMFVRTQVPKPPGTVFHFEFKLEDETKLIQGMGKVVWVRENDESAEKLAGMGVTFLELDSDSRQLIYRVTDEHIKGGGVPFELGDGPPPEPQRPKPPAAQPEAPSVPPRQATRAPAASQEARHTPAPPSKLVMGSQLSVSLPGLEEPAATPDPSASPGEGRWMPPEPHPEPEVEGPWGRAAPRRRSLAPVLGVLLVLVALAAAGFFFFPDLLGSGWTSSAKETVGGWLASFREKQQAVSVAESEAGESQTAPEATVGEPLPASPSGSATSPTPDGTERPGVDERPAAAATGTGAALLTRIEEITWRREGQELVVDVRADGRFARASYSYLRLEGDSPRVLLRIRGVRRPYGTASLSVQGSELQQIRTGFHEKPEGNELHVVLDLASSQVTLLGVQEEGSHLLLRVGRGS
jgi:uncharacterized protein (TIGR02266 family)